MKKYSPLLLVLPALIACTNEEPNPELVQTPVVVPGEGNTPDYNPAETPSFTYSIAPYAGQKADDTPAYPIGNSELNPEENNWEATITVTYSAEGATVDGAAEAGVTARVNGGNVDLGLGADKLIRVVATGTCANGSLRLSGDRRHMLELDHLTLSSTDRPAINDQNKKRVFLKLTGTSSISDGTEYTATAEDRKGCFFAEGHVVLCGDGALEVTGRYRHGFATDGFLYVNPGSTLAVTDAAKNAIHVKGSGANNEYRGIEVTGGYIYANTSAPAGKAMKCDSEIRLRGGRISLNCSGNPALDTSDNTLSSAACIKSDNNVILSGGTIDMCATGHGGKGINSDTDIEISGGIIHTAISGDGVAEQGDTSTPKAIIAHGNLTIDGGGLYLSAIGQNSLGIDTDGTASLNGGVTCSFGTACGLRAASTTYTGGILLAGGANNVDTPDATVYTYPEVSADEVTEVIADGTRLIASFRWPVALTPANLLTYGINR